MLSKKRTVRFEIEGRADLWLDFSYDLGLAAKD